MPFQRKTEISSRLLCIAGRARCLSALVLASTLIVLSGDQPVNADDGTSSPGRVEHFEKSVRPLLIEKCTGCHGDKKQWAGLRLDSLRGMLKGGDSGPAIVPGKAAESLLISAVKREGLEMPPDEPLTARQIQVLEQWIRDGAVWPEAPSGNNDRASQQAAHWAFQPLSHPVPPAVAGTAIQTPVDQFIVAKLASAGLGLSAPADRRTLIRRATYDLTGLPPTPAEVQAFVDDPAADAYEKLIDRLLDSPHYGEQWGRHWLDIARYSDTKGYVYAREERFLVQAPAYRDWVVSAFQNDIPYDRFLLLQLAADQIAEDPHDIAAMGFLTVGRRFLGVTPDIIDDRIDTVCRGMLGLTVSCARCHDHKYDPIPTADYYSFYGVFQNTTEKLVQLEQPAQASDAYAAFETELKKRQEALETKRIASREEAARRVRERITDYLVAQTELGKYPIEGFDQILAPTDMIPGFVRHWQNYLRKLPATDPVFGPWQKFAALDAKAFGTEAIAVTEQLKHEAESGVNPLIRATFQEPPQSPRDVAERYGKVFAAVHQQWTETLQAASTAGATPLPTSLADPAAEALRQVLYGPGSPCLVPDEAIVTTERFYDSGTVTELWRLQGEVDRWIIRSAEAPAFGVAVVDSAQVTEPQIFRRGNPATRGDFVPRQFLKVIAGQDRQPFQSGSGRLEMARAIVDPANPLTSRVWVNRVWQHHFGAGLVTTPSDFGTRALPPSHPELLDWLAGWFMQQGWSTKQLHRLILLSAVYRQQSVLPTDPEVAAQALQVDPENRLLWHATQHRLTFEELRDTLLAVTGELDRRQGGRASDLMALSNHRRSLYGLIDRQFLPGTLRVFDFANPDLHTAERSETTVPQQALYFLNHPFMAARSRALADKLSRTEESQRINALFQAVYQRPATTDELSAVQEFLTAARHEPVPVPPVETKAWSYGIAKIDPEQQQLSDFQPLPHFTGSAWQGGSQWPDSKFGWAQLTATGGHPGNDLQHAVVRRWTAPVSGTIAIDSLMKHEPPAGDGIRYWIISSRQGVLKTALVHQQEVQVKLDQVAVEAGETIDFVVDIHQQLNSDQYLWAPKITALSGGTPESGTNWDAERDFHGPPVQHLKAWEQLAQVLLSSNELMFVD